MEPKWTSVIDAIGKTYVVSGLIPLGLGGVINLLKWWIIGEDEYRKRVVLVREAVIQRQVTALAEVLTQTQSSKSIAEIRSPDNGKDPIELYVKHSFSVLLIHRKLDQLLSRVRRSYTALMWTTILPLVMLLVAFAIEDIRPLAATVCYFFVVTQLIIFVYLRQQKNILENHEDSI